MKPYTMDLARKIVLLYFQAWGQTIEERINTINETLEFVGLRGQISWNKEKEELYADGPDEKHIETFHHELCECFPLGSLEREASAIERVLKKWKKPDPEETS